MPESPDITITSLGNQAIQAEYRANYSILAHLTRVLSGLCASPDKPIETIRVSMLSGEWDPVLYIAQPQQQINNHNNPNNCRSI
jgi:hypothetical protein